MVINKLHLTLNLQIKKIKPNKIKFNIWMMIMQMRINNL